MKEGHDPTQKTVGCQWMSKDKHGEIVECRDGTNAVYTGVVFTNVHHFFSQ